MNKTNSLEQTIQCESLKVQKFPEQCMDALFLNIRDARPNLQSKWYPETQF